MTTAGLPCRPRVDPVRCIVLHWTGGEGPIEQVKETLRLRGCSYHYVLDQNGWIYNLVSTEYVAYHAGKWNEGSIGVSLVSKGVGKSIREKYSCVIRHKRYEMLEFYPLQTSACIGLVKRICAQYHIPSEFHQCDGRMCTDLAPEGFRGILGHYQVSKKKIDPGPRLLEDLRRNL